MGSFNATCIVSGLQIEAGDPVRFLALMENKFSRGNDHACYVTGRWQPRTAPLRARYNDYGSVEEIEESLTTQVFFASFDQDVIEKGVGDNQCHDVQVRKGMSQKDWLEALWEGRVFASPYDKRVWDGKMPRQNDDSQPKGCPTIARIEKILQEADLKIVTEYGAKGFVIDEVAPGFVRVRDGRHERKTTGLEKVQGLVQAAGYAAMITCGTGHYANAAELLIAPKPGIVATPQGQSYDLSVRGMQRDDAKDKERAVAAVMIREDVWQILLKTTEKDWQGRVFTAENMKEMARAALESEREFRRRQEAEQDAGKKFRNFLRRRDEDEGNVFLRSMLPGEGISGFYIREAFELGIDLAKSEDELLAFVDDLAELVFVQGVYATIHGQWHPSTNSSQEGNWEEHRAFLRACAEIKGRWEEDEAP